MVSKECCDVTSLLKRITLAVVLTENRLKGDKGTNTGKRVRKRLFQVRDGGGSCSSVYLQYRACTSVDRPKA